jgi:hypothetical protein
MLCHMFSYSPCQGKFGQEMRIVAYQKGLRKECMMTFTCTVSSALFPKVSAWLNRNIFSLYVAQYQPSTILTILPPYRNIEDSLCLSLGCYSITDLQEESVQTNYTTLEQKTSVTRSHWPQRGGLSMNVQFKDGREDLPLSPPFQVSISALPVKQAPRDDDSFRSLRTALWTFPSSYLLEKTRSCSSKLQI